MKRQESPRGARVLIVDDDPAIRQVLHDALENSGFAVAEASNGTEALSVFSTSEPEIVVLDATMPELSGMETCARLRGLPGGEATPVLMLMDFDDVHSMEGAYQAGASDFVTKPLDLTLFGTRIRYMLRAKRMSEALRARESRFADAQRIARLGNWEWNLTSGEFQCSDEIYRIYGIARESNELSYERFLDRVHPDDQHLVIGAIQAAIDGTATDGIDLRITLTDGTVRFIHQKTEVVRDERDRPVRIIGTTQDITERRQTEDRIRSFASYDNLTHLPNRSLFIERLRLILAEAKRHDQLVAVLCMDLDRFKRINDTMGHGAGDRLLLNLVERLKHLVRTTDTIARGDLENASRSVARLDGDEFVLSLVGVSRGEYAAKVALRIMESLRQPFEIDEGEVVITSSIGISLYPGDGETVETLLENAETAMFHAKRAGRDRYEFYDGSMSSSAAQRLRLETSLRRAIDRDELTLHYQPQVDVRDGTIVGVEALIRWRHPEIGMIPPAEFIPLAEETGLIVQIGEWVLRKACSQALEWQQGHAGLRMAINVSGLQFRPHFVKMIKDVVSTVELDPSLLELEITESVFMEQADKTVGMLEELKSIGLRLSIDDFGTGYSSLSYLKRFPIDALKVDRSFVRDIASEPDDAAITAAIIAMARSLHIEPVAEGVETPQQLEYLQRQGCVLMQGFLFSRPVPAEHFTEVLRKGALASPAGKPIGE